jgi:hypothetical protein
MMQVVREYAYIKWVQHKEKWMIELATETNLLRCVNDTCVVAKLQHTQNGSKNGVDQETR